MSDTYQAVYDATRSRIHNGDIGAVVREVATNAFDFSPRMSSIADDFAMAIRDVREAMLRPSVLFRPELSKDGDRWCAMYGANHLDDGVAGFGDTPEAAISESCLRGQVAKLTQQLAEVTADRDELHEKNTRLRRILAHVPAKIAIQAKESAGYGEAIRPLSYAEIREQETNENDVREI